MKIEQISAAALVPYARNSRTHTREQITQIAASIKEFGFTNPVLIDNEGGIIAGHGRVLAAIELCMEEVPCIMLGYLTKQQKQAYVIADNKIALNAGWDQDMLSLEISDLQDNNFNIEVIGFSEDEISNILLKNEESGLTDDDDVPVTNNKIITKPNDAWMLGDHKLMCGDSTNADALQKLCSGKEVDMWITDPPYNIAYEGKTKDALKIANDSMSDDDFLNFLTNSYLAADSVLKSGGVFYIWHADSESLNFRLAAKKIGWVVRQCLIWKKSTITLGRQDYQWKHEPCLYGWKSGKSHFWASDRKQTTILEFDKPSKNLDHPTMKPVELIEYQMLNNTKAGDTVLDSFGGSGTTLIAAQKNRRIARIMEIDPKYCDVIVRRWQNFTGQDATLEANGKTFSDLEKL